MPEIHRLYLDHLLRLDVAMALRDEGHDVLCASEVGQARSNNFAILQKTIVEDRILVTIDENFGDWVFSVSSRN
jgi:predicted nuclease of predicted toxin-antitoxin system